MVKFNFLRTFVLTVLLVMAAQISVFAGITEPLEIVNETGKDIISLYFVPVQKKSWGNDLVGSGVMNQGDRRSINYDPSYKLYKLKIEFADGTEVTRKDIDILDTWRLSIDKNGACIKNARG